MRPRCESRRGLRSNVNRIPPSEVAQRESLVFSFPILLCRRCDVRMFELSYAREWPGQALPRISRSEIRFSSRRTFKCLDAIISVMCMYMVYIVGKMYDLSRRVYHFRGGDAKRSPWSSLPLIEGTAVLRGATSYADRADYVILRSI